MSPERDGGDARSQMKRLVLCLDGTWNNPYSEKERSDGSKVFRPSNVLKMSRAVRPLDGGGTHQITYYDIGVGAVGAYPGASNWALGKADGAFGGMWGAGFEANVEAAMTFLTSNYRPGDEIYLFGFSRGAAQARALTRFMSWLGGIPEKNDEYYVPKFFRTYLETKGSGDPKSIRNRRGERPADRVRPAQITLLGVWDTVMSVGSRFRAAHGARAARSFHTGAEPAACVLHARHAVAVDERRLDFRPDIWRACGQHQTMEQVWFAGAHSNVGGGYAKDGLANHAFQWFVSEANALGLETDPDYTVHFEPYSGHKLYESKTPFYRVADFARFRRKKGVRSLLGHPPEANLRLSCSVIERVLCDPADHEDMTESYRPANVRDFLLSQPDLDAYLRSIGCSQSAKDLPADFLR